MNITKCTGEGQGSCKRCWDNGKWNRMWMYSLYEIEGYDGCYCADCVKELQELQDNSAEKGGEQECNIEMLLFLFMLQVHYKKH